MTHRDVVPDPADLEEVLGLGVVVVLDGEGAGGDIHHRANNVQDGVLHTWSRFLFYSGGSCFPFFLWGSVSLFIQGELFHFFAQGELFPFLLWGSCFLFYSGGVVSLFTLGEFSPFFRGVACILTVLELFPFLMRGSFPFLLCGSCFPFLLWDLKQCCAMPLQRPRISNTATEVWCACATKGATQFLSYFYIQISGRHKEEEKKYDLFKAIIAEPSLFWVSSGIFKARSRKP